MKFLGTFLFMMYLGPRSSLCQSTNAQLWIEYLLFYPFANSFSAEIEIDYNTILNSQPWRALNSTTKIEYSSGQHLDVLAGAKLSYTAQTSQVNTFEVRPFIGARVHLTPNQRAQIRLLARVEQRNLKNLETGNWEQNARPRLRLESLIPINKSTFYEDNVFYAIVDFEALFIAGRSVQEHFANRLRVRTGFGYRVSYNSRFEFIYMFQQSKNEIDADFVSSDNVLRFRYKHYLRKGDKSSKVHL